MEKIVRNRPLYAIGVVSELLEVHPETIRTWERHGVIQPPQRRSGKRSYSEIDLRRLEFIQMLTEEGLTLPAVRYFLRLYPCWKIEDCPGSMCRSSQSGFAKPCWREAATYCQAPSNEDLCINCQARQQNDWYNEPPVSNS
ncbi:MerR family transcriptional regulator [Chloroflexota bacterium]